jgi:hypothetical protein
LKPFPPPPPEELVLPVLPVMVMEVGQSYFQNEEMMMSGGKDSVEGGREHTDETRQGRLMEGER